MTYCVGLMLNQGIVFMSDTRTNAGVDNISTFRKMFDWTMPGNRHITLMTAGNLATTQSVISILEEQIESSLDNTPSIMEASSMFQVAGIVGRTLRDVVNSNATSGLKADSSFNATIILGGQIGDDEPQLFLIYPEGNFLEASSDTPFFQIGETKYGKPILVRAYDPEMSFEDAVKLLLVSFDSTVKANLSVGLPFDMQIYKTDSLEKGIERRIEVDDEYFGLISSGWGDALKSAFNSLPDFKF